MGVNGAGQGRRGWPWSDRRISQRTPCTPQGWAGDCGAALHWDQEAQTLDSRRPSGQAAPAAEDSLSGGPKLRAVSTIDTLSHRENEPLPPERAGLEVCRVSTVELTLALVQTPPSAWVCQRTTLRV